MNKLAIGRFYQGTFTATPEAQHYTRAVHMQGQEVLATVRFSYAFGDPAAPPDATCGMATKFYLPNGQGTSVAGKSSSIRERRPTLPLNPLDNPILIR
jgi:catalase